MTRPSNDAPWSSRRSLLIGAGLLLATGWLPSVRGFSADVPEPMDAAAFAARRRWIRTPFGRIACMQNGEGPAALFLHGFPLSGFQWRHAIAQLSSSRRCIAPDFMGLGHSRVAATQDLSPQAQSNMLAALLDELSIPAVDLVANDSGGTVAQLFAVQHPQRVRTMLLTNCDVHENSPPVQMKNSLAAARAGTYHQKIARHLQDRQYARSAAGIGGSAYVDPAHFSDEAIEYSFRPLVSSPLRQRQLTTSRRLSPIRWWPSKPSCNAVQFPRAWCGERPIHSFRAAGPSGCTRACRRRAASAG
jgi:haloalkane dehalogenase